jgi:pimeloyl-ACP methyl ester carboxylesterase
MASLDVGGVRLFYERTGTSGPPLVLVHGSWVDHSDWSPVVADLARDFRVLSYDRRGHSQSDRPLGQGRVEEDVDDLARLIEQLELAPAHVAGNSFGAVISLRLASRRPELFASLNVHEPPLFGLLAATPQMQDQLSRVRASVQAVVAELTRGETEAATRRFVEEMALGPGAWAALPDGFRAILLGNAPTFLDEAGDPDALRLDPAALRSFERPLLLTGGSQSPSHFGPVLDALAQALPQAQRHTFEGAGHLPHQSHPAAYAERVRAFLA